jgi:PIN domain nuclease of toxin-antitoxin system
MKILLDTHTFLWWVADDPQISTNAKYIISNPDNEVYFMVSPQTRKHVRDRALSLNK